MSSRPLSAPPNRTSRKPTSKSSSTSKSSTASKSSSKYVSSMKKELKELRQWKTKTDKLLVEIDKRMDTLNNNVMDELDSKDKKINSLSKELEKVKRNLKNMAKDVEKTKRGLTQLDDKVHDSTIDMDRMTYVMNVVKYILKQELNVDLTPYHIDAHRPNVTSVALSRSSPRV